ncbi:hypothetical protein Cst04h_15160 [Corynebacterium striatum]|uniref:Uncharacterized protein n=1 Tax=Corynebacterium striatum TaxID=43770 RepID=A0ABC9ZN20_CORST|nr:hypothetical protein HMPREF0308_0956 [Corynebacterium striatum ATCC 6940]GEA43346.1 hypothetical protein Cst04h_15160 [Corynebacterium striatum]GKH17530.1 hypothetical protein CE91St29_18430 [Corynebacterium striatum]CQD09290.1 conserved hypothetical protein [Corynebacterium striatum]
MTVDAVPEGSMGAMAGIMLPTAVVMAAKVGVPVVVAIGGPPLDPLCRVQVRRRARVSE